MAKFNCYATISGSKYLGQVEADTSEEAEEKAFKLPSASVHLCHQCAEDIEDPEVTQVSVEKAD